MGAKKAIILILLLQAALGIYTFAHYPIEDVAIHAEITNVLKLNGFSLSYQPYSNTMMTYPPLFHYTALPFSFLMNQIYAVRLVGLVAFILFPYFMYLLGKTFSQNTARLALIASVMLSNLVILMSYSGMPQILAMDFFILFLYFYFEKKYKLSGLFIGLAALTHPFIGVVAWLSIILLAVVYRDKNTFKTISIGIAISLLWSYQYYALLKNILAGTWNNTQYYNLNPGFIGKGILVDYLIRLNLFLVLFSFCAISFKSKKEAFFSWFYIINIFFVIYHYTPTQLKFLDLFTVPLVLFAAVGLEKIIKRYKSKTVLAVLLILFAVSYSVSLMVIQDTNKNNQAINDEAIAAAKFLKRYDPNFSRIIFFGESKTEVLFAALADKLPLNAKISDLEAYPENYKMQLSDREKIIQGQKSLLGRYHVKYVISNDCTSRIIFANSKIKVCQLY